jgi:molybdopterin-guanine dinucleotide biosynthesis protein A
VSIEAYILVGGRSTRLGRDKAFVQIGRTTLAERALNTIRESGIASKTTFVAGNETQFAIQAITLDAPFIFDLVEGRGPLGGLHAALSYAQSEWILLLACDYPFVSTDLLKLLVDKISDDFGSIVPEQPDGRPQPLCAFYNLKTAGPVVEEIIHANRVPPPMREIVRQLEPRILKPDEYQHLEASEKFFTNINTADDLDAIHEIERKPSSQ